MPVTIPVSGDENRIQVGAQISGTMATIDKIDLSALGTVIGDHVETGVVTIDFSVLDKGVDTVEIPANVVKKIAEAVNDPNNDAESLKIIFTDGTSIEFDAKTLGEKSRQADGVDISISIRHTKDIKLNLSQRETVTEEVTQEQAEEPKTDETDVQGETNVRSISFSTILLILAVLAGLRFFLMYKKKKDVAEK